MEGLREEAIMSKQLGALINISFVYFLAQVAKAERPVKNNLTKRMTEDQKKIHDFAPYWEQREKNKKFLAQSKMSPSAKNQVTGTCRLAQNASWMRNLVTPLKPPLAWTWVSANYSPPQTVNILNLKTALKPINLNLPICNEAWQKK